MIKPTATTCMDMSWVMPNNEHVRGMSNSNLPITPEAQQAANVVTRANMIAKGMEREIPIVWQVTKAITAMVTATPLALIVEPMEG